MRQPLRDVVVSRVVEAPVEVVWHAWTDPALIEKWWVPRGFTASVVRLDFRVDGTYLCSLSGRTARHGPVTSFWAAGAFEEIEPMERVVATAGLVDESGAAREAAAYGFDKAFPSRVRLTARFSDVPPRNTRLVLRLSAFEPDTVSAHDALKRCGMERAMAESLETLARAIG
jgi:uncharacterized protein YndB with AHSA1/START domain